MQSTSVLFIDLVVKAFHEDASNNLLEVVLHWSMVDYEDLREIIGKIFEFWFVKH
jgi:hypothetical protein